MGAPAPAAGSHKFKVAVLGAAGGIGQPLSLLLKNNELVGELNLYDVANVTGYNKEHLDQAKNCPNAIVNIICNPVNSTVPIFAGVMKKHGVYAPRKILGVTMLDVVRSKEFIGAMKSVNPQDVSIPVIGGHAGATVLPLLSRVSPAHITFSDEELKALTPRIQNAGTEVVEAKAGAGSATLSMAQAAAEFATACMRGMGGEHIVECCYCENNVTELRFFATLCSLGPNGVEKAHPLPSMSAFEQEGLVKAKEALKGSIDKGVKFVTN